MKLVVALKEGVETTQEDLEKLNWQTLSNLESEEWDKNEDMMGGPSSELYKQVMAAQNVLRELVKRAESLPRGLRYDMAQGNAMDTANINKAFEDESAGYYRCLINTYEGYVDEGEYDPNDEGSY